MCCNNIGLSSIHWQTKPIKSDKKDWLNMPCHNIFQDVPKTPVYPLGKGGDPMT